MEAPWNKILCDYLRTYTDKDRTLIKIEIPGDPPILTGIPEKQGLFELIRCSSLADIDLFVRCRSEYPTERRCMLRQYTSGEYIEHDAHLYLTPDGRGGVAVVGGELGSLFSYPGSGYGRLLVEAAKFFGAHYLTCFDCDGALPRFYFRHGFREVARYEWEPRRAPTGWNYAPFGTPDIVEMSL